jgi:hypothetical protein
MGTMTVKAREGTRCPMEGNPRRYITDAAPSAVPDTRYYRRLLRDGSLVPAEPPKQAKASRKKEEGGKQS